MQGLPWPSSVNRAWCGVWQNTQTSSRSSPGLACTAPGTAGRQVVTACCARRPHAAPPTAATTRPQIPGPPGGLQQSDPSARRPAAPPRRERRTGARSGLRFEHAVRGRHRHPPPRNWKTYDPPVEGVRDECTRSRLNRPTRPRADRSAPMAVPVPPNGIRKAPRSREHQQTDRSRTLDHVDVALENRPPRPLAAPGCPWYRPRSPNLRRASAAGRRRRETWMRWFSVSVT
jgi:hypothetical protein